MIQRTVQFVSSSGAAWPWQRQMPGDDGIWGLTQYVIDAEPQGVPDWLVVYEAWPQGELSTQVPRSRRILITGEPENFHRYQPRFLDQFGHVITTQRGIRHPGVIYSQVAINWFAGVRFVGPNGPYLPDLRFPDFVAGNPPKTKLCSVVCSSKAVTRGHRRRLAFVEQLKAAMGDQVDVYGRGFHEISDKDEALADYRFHIALENSSSQDYWTEKLADPFLRGCLPIYAGCPNVADYFPEGSYVSIDIGKPKQAIELINTVLKSQIDLEHAADLAEAKRRVLWEHNVFALLERIYPSIESVARQEGNQTEKTLLLSDHAVKDQGLRRRINRYVRQLWK
jgi:hypothetical protein